MKRKVIALLLIAVMAFTVCSTVAITTTQKVAAASTNTQTAASANTQPKPIVIDYKPGAKYTIWGWQFNNRYTSFLTISGKTEPKHFEMAYGGTALSWILASPSQGGWSGASTGPLLKLDLKGADWDVVKNKPCKLTAYVSYNLAAKGDSSGIGAYLDLGTFGVPSWRKDVGFGDNPDKLSGSEKLTFSGTVGYPGSGHGFPPWFFSDSFANTPYVCARPSLSIMSSVTPSDVVPYVGGQTAGSLFCSKIVIEFPAS